MVECDLPKVEIAGSSPVSRSIVTKGMFWKRFYFVVILLSCNCFLLCCNGFCKLVKEIFCCGQSETTTISDNGQADNKDNNFGEYNNINNIKVLDNNNSNNSSVNGWENGYEDNNNSSNEEENSHNDNNLVGETLPYNVQKDKNEIDLNGFDISKIIFPSKCLFLSTITRVGKTSILKCLREEEFDEEYEKTIVPEFSVLTYKETSNKKEIKIQIWDTPGDGEFSGIVTAYYKNANAIIFVYDITNVDSLKSLEKYIPEVVEKAPKGCLFFLLGNKLDLIEQNHEERQVTIDEAKTLAAYNNLIFLGECSAKENTYMPGSDEVLYCEEKELIEKDGKCTEGLYGMLKDIIYKYYISLHV